MTEKPKYMIVDKECFLNMYNCFVDSDEFIQFHEHFNSFINEMNYSDQVSKRDINNTSLLTNILMKKVFLFSLFCRDNMELINSLIKHIKFEEVTEEEKKNKGYNSLD